MWRTAATYSRVKGFVMQGLAEPQQLYSPLGSGASGHLGSCASHGADIGSSVSEKWDMNCFRQSRLNVGNWTKVSIPEVRSTLIGPTVLPAPVSGAIVERGKRKRASSLTRPLRGDPACCGLGG